MICRYRSLASASLDSNLEDGNTNHERPRAKVRTGNNDHRQTERKDKRSNRSNETWRILLIPGGSIGAEQDRTGERQEHSCEDRAHKHLIESHVCFGNTGAPDELDGLFGCVGIDCGEGVSLFRDL